MQNRVSNASIMFYYLLQYEEPVHDNNLRIKSYELLYKRQRNIRHYAADNEISADVTVMLTNDPREGLCIVMHMHMTCVLRDRGLVGYAW